MEPTSEIIDDDIHAYAFDTYGVSIIAFRSNFDIVYESPPRLSVREVGRKYKYRYLINGSFFEWTGKHAGWLSISGKHLAPFKQDRQLTHITMLNTQTGSLTFHPIESWDMALSDKSNLEFQTGPLVIQNNAVDTASISQSINGLSSHSRTLLGYTEQDQMKFFITVRKPISLDTLGEYLMKVSIFEGKRLSVINLDGGPSVALATLSHPELNHNEKAVLPILFAVR